MQTSLNEEKYFSFLNELEPFLHPKDAVHLKEAGNFRYEGIEHTLVYSHVLYPDTLFLLCDLGWTAQLDQKESYQRMLEFNFFLIHESGPQMAIDPETKAPLLITRLPLEGITAQLFIENLKPIIVFIKEWRMGNFSNLPIDKIKKN